MNASSTSPKSEKAQLRSDLKALNVELANLTRNRYFESCFPNEIARAIEAAGFSTDNLDGVYAGREGRVHEDIGRGIWLTLTWHKMEVTGTYEVVAYAN